MSMIILILGPQGSGKGTQAKQLADKFGLMYFSTGEYLRKLSDGNGEIARKLNTGVLFADEEVFEYVTAFFETAEKSDGIVLDGYPRSAKQYGMLSSWLGERDSDIDLAISLEVGENESIRRLSNRRMDPKTGNIYNLVTAPKPGVEIDLESLIQRDDDKPEAIRKRLEEYRKKTQPLVDKLEKQGKLKRVDGERGIEEIQKDLVKIVEGAKK